MSCGCDSNDMTQLVTQIKLSQYLTIDMKMSKKIIQIIIWPFIHIDIRPFIWSFIQIFIWNNSLVFLVIHRRFEGQFCYLHYPTNTLSYSNESLISNLENKHKQSNPSLNQRYGMSSSHIRKLCNLKNKKFSHAIVII